MTANLKSQLRGFILENFLFGDTSKTFSDQDSFLGKGIIDSTGVLELISYLQENFEIVVEDEELIPENLDSLDNLIAFVQRKSSEVQV